MGITEAVSLEDPGWAVRTLEAGQNPMGCQPFLAFSSEVQGGRTTVVRRALVRKPLMPGGAFRAPAGVGRRHCPGCGKSMRDVDVT